MSTELPLWIVAWHDSNPVLNRDLVGRMPVVFRKTILRLPPQSVAVVLEDAETPIAGQHVLVVGYVPVENIVGVAVEAVPGSGDTWLLDPSDLELYAAHPKVRPTMLRDLFRKAGRT